MRIGCVRERKDGEDRVGLTPEGVAALRSHGHAVVVEHDAGAESGFPDAAYEAAGAAVVGDGGDVWGQSELVVKVKEPIAEEYEWLHEGCAVFGYLHLAADRALTETLLAKKVTALAPELIRLPSGLFPLLAPMSQIAGRMAAEVGAQLLRRPGAGRGMLLGGVAGVPPGKAVVLGSGTVGTSAVRVLLGLGAQVTLVSDDLPRLRQLVDEFDGRVTTRVSNSATIADALRGADLAILAVLVPGAHAPRVVTREMVRTMSPGAVLVDVSIDQGGASETSRVTTHSDPTYVDEGVVHYCVANMPGAVPQTSTLALTSASLPYVLAMADRGVEGALQADQGLAESLSTFRGSLVHQPVAEEFGLPWTPNPFLKERRGRGEGAA